MLGKLFLRQLTPAWFMALAGLGLCGNTALAQVTIYGGLSNFDCPNETDEECDEFEIELHGPHPEDVYHTYHNPNFGSPEISAIPGGTLVRYGRPHHRTTPGTIEHFGVCFRNFNADPTPSFRWKANGHEAGVNNSPIQPQIVTETGYNTDGDRVIREIVTNNDEFGRRMWIKRSVTNVSYQVSLEELMRNNPLVQNSEDIDLSPVLLNPGTSVVFDQLEVESGTFSAVINYEVYRDRFQSGTHHVGQYAGAVMNAINLVTDVCTGGEPFITEQPLDETVQAFGETLLRVVADSNYDNGPLNFQWYHEGVAIDGADGDELTLSDITPADAGAYWCIVSNDCSMVVSTVGRVTVILCPGDYNEDGFVDGFDYDDFVSDFEDGSPRADFNRDGFMDGFDYDDFVTAFEDNC